MPFLLPAPWFPSPPQCTVNSGIIGCSVSANITVAKKALLTSSTTAPYRTTPAVMLALFGDTVSQWFTQLIATQTAQRVASTLDAASFFTVDLQISQRFIDAMGSNLYTTATAAFLADLLNATSISGITV